MADEPSYFDVVLSHKVSGSNAGPMKLQFWTMQLSANDPEQDAQLTTVDLKGFPLAEGIETTLEPLNKSFKGDQTWTLPKQTITVEDDNEKEYDIELRNLVIKLPQNGQPSAKCAVSADGKDVLATPNWKD